MEELFAMDSWAVQFLSTFACDENRNEARGTRFAACGEEAPRDREEAN